MNSLSSGVTIPPGYNRIPVSPLILRGWGAEVADFKLVFNLKIIAGIGTLLLVSPGIGAAVISLMLAALFIFGGVYKVVVVSRGLPNRGWSRAGSIVSILLGLFILARWPLTNFVVLGTLIGIEILRNGWSIAVIEYAEKRVKKRKMA